MMVHAGDTASSVDLAAFVEPVEAQRLLRVELALLELGAELFAVFEVRCP